MDWQEYPDEVVDRKWRTDAARLHRVLDALGVRHAPDPTSTDPDGPTLARVMDHLTGPPATVPTPPPAAEARSTAAEPDTDEGVDTVTTDADAPAPVSTPPGDREDREDRDDLDALDDLDDGSENGTENGTALAARLSAEIAREEEAAVSSAPGTASQAGPATSVQGGAGGPDTALWDDGTFPLFPLQPPRTARELLTDHVTAMVCCAAMDTAGATPGLDWLDGPSLMVNGERAADLAPRVLSLVEDGDPAPLRAWLVESGIRPEKPVRLV